MVPKLKFFFLFKLNFKSENIIYQKVLTRPNYDLKITCSKKKKKSSNYLNNYSQ